MNFGSEDRNHESLGIQQKFLNERKGIENWIKSAYIY